MILVRIYEKVITTLRCSTAQLKFCRMPNYLRTSVLQRVVASLTFKRQFTFKLVTEVFRMCIVQLQLYTLQPVQVQMYKCIGGYSRFQVTPMGTPAQSVMLHTYISLQIRKCGKIVTFREVFSEFSASPWNLECHELTYFPLN